MNSVTSTEYRHMSRKERAAFRKSGGQIIWLAKDVIGATLSVLALCGIGWIVSASDKPVDYERNAQARCLAEGVNGVQGLKPVYNSVASAKDKHRYVVTFDFTAPNGIGKSIPGRLYCETDLAGESVLLVNVARR